MRLFDSFKKANKNEEKREEKKNNHIKSEFNLGTFSFSEEERKRLKAVAIKYMPENLNTVGAQKTLLNNLSSVMDVSVPLLNFEFFSYEDTSSNKDEVINVFIKTVTSVNSLFPALNPKKLLDTVNSADCDDLLKSWATLDYYASIIKPEHTVNIRHFRDYIHNRIVTEFEDRIKEKVYNVVRVEDNNVYISSYALFEWKRYNPAEAQIEFNGAVYLKEKDPVICLYEDGVKTLEYCLQTEDDEDFTGKYFLISVRVGVRGEPALPLMQIDGFISDSPEERKMTINDIGYRMEGHLLACGGDKAKEAYEKNRGHDLVIKGLKYPGYTTPSCVRLVGICPDCKKSFAFHGYAFYMAQSDVAYSDDGLDCCEIQSYEIDKDTWKYEADGKTFRYYNSFNCPHCGAPYIDYKKRPEIKSFGVSGCVHLGRKQYTAK